MNVFKMHESETSEAFLAVATSIPTTRISAASMTEAMLRITPFHFGFNNLVAFNDPDGAGATQV